MNNIFRDIESLREKFPGVAAIIENENELQYPNAKFLIAGLEEPLFKIDGEYETINAFFDVGVEGKVLWIWVGGGFRRFHSQSWNLY